MTVAIEAESGSGLMLTMRAELEQQDSTRLKLRKD